MDFGRDGCGDARRNRRRVAGDFSGISIDSRTVAPGEAYFAIKGDVHDGHAFVDAALKAGAGLAVVEAAQRDKFAADAPLLIVDDVLAGLRDLARASRERLTAQVIAVTGSVGKTSTKEALRNVLAAQGNTHASVASFNNHWGVPLSLARCPADTRFAIFEIGMNHAGEIVPLVKMVRPHVAIITTVEPVHLEFFSGVEAIADAKAEIFEGVEPNGAVVLNRDNAQFARLQKHARKLGIARIVSFGADEKADARLLDLALHPACSALHAQILDHDITYKLAMPGRHMAMNSLAVLAAASLAGADLALAGLALSQAQPAAGRGVRHVLTVSSGEATLIDESYNANPASMAAALNVLGQARSAPRAVALLCSVTCWNSVRRRGAASRAGRCGQCQYHRHDILLRPPDAQSVGCAFLRQAGRLCRGIGRARIAGGGGCSRRRRHYGQGLARLADEGDCDGA